MRDARATGLHSEIDISTRRKREYLDPRLKPRASGTIYCNEQGCRSVRKAMPFGRVGPRILDEPSLRLHMFRRCARADTLAHERVS
jgi:hypothetical protein